MVGYLAKSLAGHDKGNIYIIIEETETDVLVADGKYKTLEHPKRKNKKHIQVIKQKNAIDTNEAIKYSIKEYLRRTMDV
ncbi:MAG: KOW domain-containing RNA-binding protein [Lachnospiraceae bacterium]|nr:KOW domain-containing RNA-binding protein [Lachnospiraceae bacterium]